MGGTARLLGLALLCGIIGCEDERPLYVELAPGPGANAATLKGAWGTYIEEVDGARVGGFELRFSSFGWNTVTVTPGVHKLLISQWLATGESRYIVTAEGIPVRGRTSEVARLFAFRCDAGHVYELGPTSIWHSGVLQITDTDTKQSLIVKGRSIDDW